MEAGCPFWTGSCYSWAEIGQVGIDYSSWQHERDTRIVGRWYRKGDALQVSIQGKKQPITVAADAGISVRTLTDPAALKPGFEVVEVKGKRFGSDLHASRVVVLGP